MFQSRDHASKMNKKKKEDCSTMECMDNEFGYFQVVSQKYHFTSILQPNSPSVSQKDEQRYHFLSIFLLELC